MQKTLAFKERDLADLRSRSGELIEQGGFVRLQVDEENFPIEQISQSLFEVIVHLEALNLRGEGENSWRNCVPISVGVQGEVVETLAG